MNSEAEVMSIEDAIRFRLVFSRRGFQTPSALSNELEQILAAEKLKVPVSHDEPIIACMTIQKPKRGLLAFAVEMVISKEETSIFWIGEMDAQGKWGFVCDEGWLYITSKRLILFYRKNTAAPKPDGGWNVKLSYLKTVRFDDNILVLSWHHTDVDLRLSISFPQASPTQILAGLEPYDANITDRYRSAQNRDRVERLSNKQASAKEILFEFFAAIVQSNQAVMQRKNEPPPLEHLPQATLELLEKLSQLKTAGVLTESEYQQKKQELLSRL